MPMHSLLWNQLRGFSLKLVSVVSSDRALLVTAMQLEFFCHLRTVAQPQPSLLSLNEG